MTPATYCVYCDAPLYGGDEVIRFLEPPLSRADYCGVRDCFYDDLRKNAEEFTPPFTVRRVRLSETYG